MNEVVKKTTGPAQAGSVAPGDASLPDLSRQGAEASLAERARRAARHGQFVLVLQGGGALGAYQVGVYQALHEAGIEPDWVIGTSIGAINAGIIAGNAPEDRLAKLDAFWRKVQQLPSLAALGGIAGVGPAMANWATVTYGISGFFRPNPLAFLGLDVPLAPDGAGYYSTRPLANTLAHLIDFERIKSGPTRLTVGAANVRTSEMRYFDSRDGSIALEHVMASGALPPAFPAIRIDGELYWDGGILSNTPVEAVFDDNPRKNSLVFAVHIWNPNGSEPETIRQVMNRQKDVQYSSRAASHIKRQRQLHRLRHVIAELVQRIPEAERDTPAVRELAAYGCLTRMHVVRLLAPSLDGEDHTKDVDFSAKGIRARREAGYRDTMDALRQMPWEGEVDALEGFVLHELQHGATMVEL
jgi:NTE family protein